MTLDKLLNDMKRMAREDGEHKKPASLLTLLDYAAIIGIAGASRAYFYAVDAATVEAHRAYYRAVDAAASERDAK